MRDLAKVVMNPIRQRILQALLVHGKSSTKDIGEELNDVPAPTLYRHIKILLDADVIMVAQEEPIRGTIQRIYAVNPEFMNGADANDTNLLIQNTLHSLCASFQMYFAKGKTDMQKDLLSVSTSTLLLSDAEFMDFLQELSKLIGKHISNQPTSDRKTRRFTFISSPSEED